MKALIMRKKIISAVFSLLFCLGALGQTEGQASYYANHFHGRRTSSGSIYDKNGYTCAHRTLPFGTMLKVTNLRNNKSTIVKVTDRGPFTQRRIIDLSYAAARDIGLVGVGVTRVRIEKVTSEEVNEAELEHLKIPKPFKEEDLTIDFKAFELDTLWELPF